MLRKCEIINIYGNIAFKRVASKLVENGGNIGSIIYPTILDFDLSITFMVLSKTILILEDDLLTLSKVLDKLVVLEQDQPFDLSVIVLTNHEQVENMVNKNPDIKPDIILLDRDCKLGGSFHVLDIERFGADKVISISSVPKYNEDARLRGVKRIVEKTLENREGFADKVVAEIADMIRKMPLT